MERPKRATMARDPLSKERVLHTAVQLADRGGLEALTMRKLAEELGVGVMSLYYYVPHKDELIEGMVELVFSEIQLPPNDVDWKAAMRQRAVSTREALNRHRWAVGLMESNPLPGPQSFRVHDAVLGCLREAGFSLQEKTVPFDNAAGAAAVATEQVREFAEDAEEQHSAALADEFPYLAEVVAGHVTKVGYDFAESFDYGLDLILDALEKRRDAASSPSGGR